MRCRTLQALTLKSSRGVDRCLQDEILRMTGNNDPQEVNEDRWFKVRGYPHFDLPIGKQKARSHVQNAKKVSSHSFYPFISYIKKVPRYDRTQKKVIEKKRPIAYAAHMDSHIYAWYSHVLSQRYEQVLQQADCDQTVLAYRKLGRKCNIHFAAEAFDEVRKLMPCVVLAIDISKFFDNIDHSLLKKQWEQLLNVDRLSEDHFAVFKSITKYSYVDKMDLFTALSFQTIPSDNPHKRLCSPEDFRTKIREQKLIKSNMGKKGIPQGSPMSAVLSNIYMLPFDKTMNTLAGSLGGVYRRYCDDILMIVPVASSAGIERKITDAINERAQEINLEKTERRLFRKSNTDNLAHSYEIPFSFEQDSSELLQSEMRRYCNWKMKPLQYLGFLFDGSRTLIRTQSIARYYRRMKTGVYFAAKNASENQNPEGKRIRKFSLYETYSHLGRRNFVRYGYRASSIMKARAIRKQLKKHWKALHQQIDKKSSDKQLPSQS